MEDVAGAERADDLDLVGRRLDRRPRVCTRCCRPRRTSRPRARRRPRARPRASRTRPGAGPPSARTAPRRRGRARRSGCRRRSRAGHRAGPPRSRRGRRVPRRPCGRALAPARPGRCGRYRRSDDRAAVAADQDRALRRAGSGTSRQLRDVDALVLEPGTDPPSQVVVSHGADEVRLDAESRERHRRGRGRPAAGNDELRRDDAVVRPGMPRHREDRVEGGETDADDVRHRAITVTISCGRYGTTIVSPSTSSSSPSSSSAFARRAESNGSARRTRATPRAPCAS